MNNHVYARATNNRMCDQRYKDFLGKLFTEKTTQLLENAKIRGRTGATVRYFLQDECMCDALTKHFVHLTHTNIETRKRLYRSNAEDSMFRLEMELDGKSCRIFGILP